MKRVLIAVLVVVACCFARSSTPYTGRLENLNIATFGIFDYSKMGENNLPYNIDFATGFRKSLQKHVSKKFPTTTFKNIYSNTTSSQVTVANFKNKIKKGDYNIVFFSGHGDTSFGLDDNGHVIRTNNIAIMYDDNLPVEDMEFSEETYFAFFDACNFLSFYTDDKGRGIYGYYKTKVYGKEVTIMSQEPITDGKYVINNDGWEDSKEAKPQYINYSKFVKAFKNGLHAMFGYSSRVPALLTKNQKAADLSFYETFADQWVNNEKMRIWQAYKYAVWSHIYNAHASGIEPAVIFRSGTAIGNDGKHHQFKGYGEYYNSIYQYSMRVNSSSALALGRKKAVYGNPRY